MAKKKKRISAEETLNQLIRNMPKQNTVGPRQTIQNNIMPQTVKNNKLQQANALTPPINQTIKTVPKQTMTPVEFIKSRMNQNTSMERYLPQANDKVRGQQMIDKFIETGKTFLKEPENIKKSRQDGFQAKDLLEGFKANINTGKDMASGISKGLAGTVKNLKSGYEALMLKYVEEMGYSPDYYNKVSKGQYYTPKELADAKKQYEDVKGRILKGEDEANKFNEWLNKQEVNPNSSLGTGGQEVFKGIGQIAGNVGANFVGGPALSYGLIGLSSAGAGTQEALKDGATLDQSLLYGAGAGLAEAGSEKIFAGIGGVVGKGAFDDVLIGKVTKDIKNRVAKTTLQAIGKASGEGIEEVVSGLAQAALQKGIYKQDEKIGKLITDQNLLEQFIMGSITSLVAGGAGAVSSIQSDTDLITGFNKKQDQVVKAIENQGKTYSQAVKEVDTDVNVNKAKYGVSINDYDTQTVLNPSTTPLQFQKTGNQYSDSLLESLSKVYNNTAEARTTALNLSKMAQESKADVEITNTQELVKRGIKSDSIVDGFNSKGKIVLNIDSPKAITMILKHELGHDMEGTQEFTDLQNTIVNEYKASGKYDTEIAKLSNLYQEQTQDMSKEQATEYLQNEMVQNEISKVFSDQDFINRISNERPGIFKRAYAIVKKAVKSLVKGSQEASYMEELQTKFEKAYKNRSKTNDIKMSKTDSQGNTLSQEQQEFFKDSKVRDKDGKLLVVYHGTNKSDLNKFKKGKFGYLGGGIYLTDQYSKAKKYTDYNIVKELYVNMKSPLIVNTQNPTKEILNTIYGSDKIYNNRESQQDYVTRLIKNSDINKLLEKGYDGVIWEFGGENEYVVFNPNQIKNTTNKKPTLDDDIRFSKSTPQPKASDRVNINKSKIDDLANAKDNSIQAVEGKIRLVKADIAGMKNQDTQRYAKAQQQLANLEARKKSLEAGYDQKIVRVENQVERSQEDVERSERFKQRKAVLQKYYTEQADIINSVEFKKDKSMGMLYATETPQRNFRDIMKTPEMAQKMIDEYITPTKDSNAAINKQAEELNNKVRALNLNKQESVYTMMLREQRFNSETALTKEDVKQYLSKHKKKINVDKVEKAIPVFTEIYNDLFKQVNKTLKQFGYKEIPYRQGYTPHFEDFGNDPFGKVAKSLGFTFEDNTIPIKISGLTENFAPGRTFNVNELQRKGDKTDYDILKGYDLYLRSALDVIHHTKNIHKLRALESAVRTIGSEESFTDALNAELKRIEDLRQQGEYVDISETINDLLAKTNNVGQMKGFVSFIHEQANIIANKQSDLDRLAEKYVNRKVLTLFKTLSTRTGINMIVGNVSSAISNSVVFQQAAAYTSTGSFTQALLEARNTAFKTSNEIKTFAEDSTFLTNRLFENKGVSKTSIQKGMEIAGALFEMTDRVTAYVTVRARYLDNTKTGMNHTEALKEADAFADNLMQARDKGSMPTAFKSGTLKGFTQFQAEVNNQIRVFLKDSKITIPEKYKDKIIAGILLGLLKYTIYSFLFNQVTEKTVGRKIALSPIDIGLDSLNISQNDDLKAGEKAQKIGRRVAEELPFIGSFLDGGRMPMSAALPDLDKIFKSENPLGVGVYETLKSVVAFYLMPFGGGQIKKTIEGLAQYTKDIPGSYTDKGQLRFEADTSVLGVLQSAIFGQWAGENARDYFDNNRRPITEKQLDDVKSGVKSVKGIQQQRELDKLNKQTAEMDKKNAEKFKGDVKPNVNAKSYEQVLAELKRIDSTKEQYSSEIEDSRKNVLVKEKKLDYLTLLKTLTDEQKNELGEKVLGREIDIKEYDKYASLEEYDFAQKKPAEYKLITSQTTFEQYKGIQQQVKEVREEYSGYSTDERKAAVWDFLKKANISTMTKGMLMREHYSGFKTMDSAILRAIDSMDISGKEKIKLAGALKYETKDWKWYMWN